MLQKAELLEAIAGKNRGLLANEVDNARVLNAIEQLEDHNPHLDPLNQKSLLCGTWRLLYTTSRGILGIENIPLLKLGEVYQYIDLDNNRLYNIGEIQSLPLLDAIFFVGGPCQAVSSKRVSVSFDRTIAGPQRLINYQSVQQFMADILTGKKFLPFDFSFVNRFNFPKNQSSPSSWLETTYLDEDLRIGRGNEGNVFIMAKA